ncbi:MAG TPA: RNA pyrophosphohydrolase [Hyphomicrobium sp.]|jgi:putative (di)nucleoside polyphosphate hydrolase
MAFTHTETYSAPLPLRPCVGVVLFNAQGLVLVGRHRPKWAAQRASYVGDAVWQLPQGGIEPREPSRETAFRELWEETGVRNAALIAEIPGWLTYELPPELLGIALKGKYAGHRLRWYAMRFEGDDSEIDIGPKGSMIKPEFDAWRWVPLADVPRLAVDFRRPVYEEVVREFARFARVRSAPIAAAAE